MKKNPLKSNAVQSLIASLVCILLGLFIGYIVLLFINPAGAGKAILDIIKNFLTYNKPASQLKYFGNTLVKTAPLLMCALAILFAYKVGLFNIGAAGQYCAGVALSLYAALGLGWSWLPCMLLAIVSGAVFGVLTDLIWKRLPHRAPEHPFEELCKDCDCEHHGIFRAALTHTVRIALFLLLVNLVLGGAIHFVGEERISQVLLSGSVLQPFVAALIGFIPNCASSVILTELYLSGSLSFGAAVAGLCTGAGVGLAVLFKYNRHLKENLLLAGILYGSAVATGLVCGLLF